jgi:hypothetical protein
MTEYALLIDSQFRESRYYAEKPDDIPHKNVAWYPVVREYGAPFEGLEGDTWYIRTVDPATLPIPVPRQITRRQCALQLLSMQVVMPQEALAMTKSAEVPAAVAQVFAGMSEEQRILAEIDFAATTYYRDNQLLGMMGLTEQQIDQFFIAAARM